MSDAKSENDSYPDLLSVSSDDVREITPHDYNCDAEAACYNQILSVPKTLNKIITLDLSLTFTYIPIQHNNHIQHNDIQLSHTVCGIIYIIQDMLQEDIEKTYNCLRVVLKREVPTMASKAVTRLKQLDSWTK